MKVPFLFNWYAPYSACFMDRKVNRGIIYFNRGQKCLIRLAVSLYSLRKEAFDQLETWVAGYRRHWEARLDRFGAALEHRQATSDNSTKESS